MTPGQKHHIMYSNLYTTMKQLPTQCGNNYVVNKTCNLIKLIKTKTPTDYNSPGRIHLVKQKVLKLELGHQTKKLTHYLKSSGTDSSGKSTKLVNLNQSYLTLSINKQKFIL